MKQVRINQPIIGMEEFQAVNKVLCSNVLTSAAIEGGPMVQQFEKNLAEYLNVKHAIAVNSGTAALHCALVAAGIGPGDEVILPSFTFIATANAVRAVGALPVFADIYPDGTIDVRQIENLISHKTKAVIPVHIFGIMAAMRKILEIAKNHKLAVIEDACQALGSSQILGDNDQAYKAGTLGDMGCFSFYASKVMTTGGEGGAVATNDSDLARKLRFFRNHKQGNVGYGLNYRMPEINAAIGIEQLKKLPDFLAHRAKNAFTLVRLIEHDKIAILRPGNQWSNWYVFTVRFTSKEERDKKKQLLNDAGIGATIYYEQPVHKLYGYSARLYETDRASNTVLSLPVHPLVETEDLEKMAEILNE